MVSMADVRAVPLGHFIGAGAVHVQCNNSTQHAFVFTTSYGMQDLNHLIATGSGWILMDARAINDRGQITGVGKFGAETHAFLLTPILPPLQITSITELENGEMRIRGLGAPSQRYTVEATTDLLTGFSPRATLTAASDGSLQFADPDAARFSRRFYRFSYP